MFFRTHFNKLPLYNTISATKTTQLCTTKTDSRETLDRRVSNFDCMLQITVDDRCFLKARSNNW